MNFRVVSLVSGLAVTIFFFEVIKVFLLTLFHTFSHYHYGTVNLEDWLPPLYQPRKSSSSLWLVLPHNHIRGMGKVKLKQKPSSRNTTPKLGPKTGRVGTNCSIKSCIRTFANIKMRKSIDCLILKLPGSFRWMKKHDMQRNVMSYKLKLMRCFVALGRISSDFHNTQRVGTQSPHYRPLVYSIQRKYNLVPFIRYVP